MIFAVLFLLSSLTLPNPSLASTEARISGMNSEDLGTLTGDDRFSGTVGFDSSSFFYRSESRGTAATTLNATLRGKSDSKILHSEGDLSAYTFVTNTPALGIESRELYVQTRAGTLGNFDIAFGRKIEEWSKLDQTWRMMSLWSPRWTWDELHPQVIGMTGLFLSYRTRNFKTVLFASPLAIPERGTPVEEKDRNIVSPNPFWKPLPEEITVLGARTKVNYSLMMPGLQEILLRPNFAWKARYDFDGGAFISMNAGVLPVHMVQMAAEPFLETSGASSRLDVNIRPQFPMRNINTLEAGYESPARDWSLWLSGSYEQPFRFQNGDTWLNPVITPSAIVSAGTSVELTGNFRFNGSLLIINEQPFSRSSRVPDVNVQLPSRFPLKQGIQIGGNWRFSDINEGNVNWIQDLIQQNHLISMDVSHWIRSARISVGAGMDVILANSTRGWVGNYYGDDRLRGWLKYAF
jgi:hypothetical protein